MVNALNLKSFIMEKSEWDFDKQKWKYMDPNYEGLDQYFTINSSGVPIPQLKGEFLYNAVQMLNQQSAYYAETLVHDENRLPEAGKDNSGSYYAGLYCPENTFTTDQVSDANLLILEEYDYPWPMITHVSITAKFTPRELYVEKEMANWIMNEEDDNVPSEMRRKIKQKVENGREFLTVEGGRTIVIINTDSEKESQAILTASLRKHYAVQESGIYDHQKKVFRQIPTCPLSTSRDTRSSIPMVQRGSLPKPQDGERIRMMRITISSWHRSRPCPAAEAIIIPISTTVRSRNVTSR